MLTAENYYEDKEYLNQSTYKDFCGTLGVKSCEAMALAKYRGEWKEEPSTAMLVGKYVDAHFEGSLPLFKAQNPNIFTQKCELQSEYKRADVVINRIERDAYFMKMLSGNKQVIMTAEFFGQKWKCRIDSLIENIAIVDLKTAKDIHKSEYVKDVGKISFLEFWGYDIQGAVYQKIVEINTGKRLPFLIAVATKEEYPDIEILGIDQPRMDACLYEVERNTPRMVSIIKGEIEPDRCGTCDYCKHTKVLFAPIHYKDLLEKI
jgi:hypothetical protein